MKDKLKKNSVLLIAILVVIVLVVAALANGAIQSSKSNDTEETTTTTDSSDTLGLGSSVARISGSSATATSLETANTMLKLSGEERFDSVIITNDQDFADALSGAYLAKVKSAPILTLATEEDGSISYSTVNTITAYLKTVLSDQGTIYILGGTATIPEDTEAAISECGTVVRLAEADRYATNLAVLDEAGISGDTLLVASGANYADSISAASTGYPMLLVGDELTYDQQQFLQNHSFTNIYILGGFNAVSEEIGTTLASYGNLERISGDSRYATSAAIAEKFFPSAETVTLTTGTDFTAGLAAAPLANQLEAPILLADKDNDKEASNYAADKNISTVVTFATAEQIPDSVMSAMK